MLGSVFEVLKSVLGLFWYFSVLTFQNFIVVIILLLECFHAVHQARLYQPESLDKEGQNKFV